MHVHFAFQDVPDAVRESIRVHCRKKEGRLGRLLVRYPPDAVDLRIVVHGPAGMGPLWRVRICLDLPGRPVVAEAASRNNPEAAIDEAAEELWRSLRDRRTMEREEHVLRRKGRRGTAIDAASAALGMDQDRQESFLALVAPNLPLLARQADREIRVLEVEGRLPGGALTHREILAEAIARAWDRLETRPGPLPVDAWMARIVEEVIEDALRGIEAGAPDILPRSGGPPDWIDPDAIADVEPAPDPVSWEDLFPGEEGVEPLRRLDRDEGREAVLAALAGLPRLDRSGFTLHALDGYAVEEVASILDRQEAEVRAGIDEVRRRLRESLGPVAARIEARGTEAGG